MAQSTFESPIKKVYGETVSLTTTAVHLAFRPNYHEVKLYCPSDYRMGIAPKLSAVKFYDGAGATYTDYTKEATDRSSSTHVPLDAMATNDFLYLGLTENTRGFYYDIGSNANAQNVSQNVEYCYDVSKAGDYQKFTGTVSAALTVGETVTGQTSGATAIHVFDDGSTFIVVKNITGQFVIGEDVDGASQTCDDLTKMEYVGAGTGYFTAVAGANDGTDSTGTLAVDGLYSFNLPAAKKGVVTVLSNEPLYWFRFAPSGALSDPTDINEIIPAVDTVNYGYMNAGVIDQFSLNIAQNGALEFDHTGSDTLQVTWIQH